MVCGYTNKLLFFFGGVQKKNYISKLSKIPRPFFSFFFGIGVLDDRRFNRGSAP